MKLTNTEIKASNVAKILIDNGAILFSRRHPFKFSSGILSPIYVDNRRIISLPRERKLIIQYFLDEIKKISNPDVIAGIATAGIPHAAWIAQKLNLPLVYVRTKPKEHGGKNQIEGIIKKGQKVIVIEDMISTASSSVEVIKALRKVQAIILGEFAIYSHELVAASKNFKKMKVRFRALSTLTVVTQTAIEKELLSGAQQKIVLEWAKDPKNWGKKMGFE